MGQTHYVGLNMYRLQLIHCMLVEVREVFAQVLSDLRIPYTRVPKEIGLHSCPWLPAHLQLFYTQVEKDAQDSMPVFARYGIRFVTFFFFFFRKETLKHGQFHFHWHFQDSQGFYKWMELTLFSHLECGGNCSFKTWHPGNMLNGITCTLTYFATWQII